MTSFYRRTAIAVWFCIFATPVWAQNRRIDPAGIDGALLLCGSDQVTAEQCERFVELAGGAKAKIVIMTVDKERWGSPPLEKLNAAAQKHQAAEATIAEYKDAKEALKGATGLWLDPGQLSGAGKVMKQYAIADECRAILKRGGVIAAAAAGVRFLGARELAINGSPCMDILPDALIEVRGKQRLSPLTKVTNPWKTLVAYEIEDDAAMLVKGRTISVVGAGAVHIHLPAGQAPRREIVIAGPGKEDLTALRRALYDRVHSFPPKDVEPPVVEKGTLVIVGGGGSPDGLYEKFVDYAGGKGKANIVIFPTANDSPLKKREVVARLFKEAGAKKATVLYAQKQADVESNEFLDALKDATGLWFDGGRQWRFVDCYENTRALPLMFDVLKRGGVIGGTSAGATIQGDYLARGGVFNNFDIRYEGYQRGLGFLKGVAIDQHFSKRKRHADMTGLMKIYPQYLGIGIDEATAIVVQGSTADVIGNGKVFFYDARRQVEKGNPDFEAVSAGGRYDLKARKVISVEPSPK